MIHLEHLNLVVKDMQKTLDFYQVVFPHWKVRGGGTSDWYGHPRNWLHFGDDYHYLTFNDNGTGDNRDLKSHQVGLAHFAFVTNDIKGLMSRLQHAGFLEKIPFEKNENRGNVYYLDPNGYEVEFVTYYSDLPALMNQYNN